MTADEEREYREEAERLKALPRDVQRQILVIFRAPADNPRLDPADRRAAAERVAALERFLGLRRRK